jgi:hypothetical protein
MKDKIRTIIEDPYNLKPGNIYGPRVEDDFWGSVGSLEEQLGLHHYRKTFTEIINK